MTYQGKVQNGVIVLADGAMLPEGTRVTVLPNVLSPAPPSRVAEKAIWEKMVEIAEEAERQPCNLPEDLADNHDHYLHGVPKR